MTTTSFAKLRAKMTSAQRLRARKSLIGDKYACRRSTTSTKEPTPLNLESRWADGYNACLGALRNTMRDAHGRTPRPNPPPNEDTDFMRGWNTAIRLYANHYNLVDPPTSCYNSPS